MTDTANDSSKEVEEELPAINENTTKEEEEAILHESRVEAAKVARSLISDEQWNSDPIYAKIDQWMIEGVPTEIIKKRVMRYAEKQKSLGQW